MLTEGFNKVQILEDGVIHWRLCDLRARILAHFFGMIDERSVKNSGHSPLEGPEQQNVCDFIVL